MKTPEQIVWQVTEARAAEMTYNERMYFPDDLAHRVAWFDTPGDPFALVIQAIEADRAQRPVPETAATSASDRYDEARAALAQLERAYPEGIGRGVTEQRAMNALRALIDPPATEETPEQIAHRLLATTALPKIGETIACTELEKITGEAITRAVHAGIQAAWDSWEAENAPGVRVATRDEYTAVCDVIDAVKTDDRSEDTDLYAGRILDALGVHL